MKMTKTSLAFIVAVCVAYLLTSVLGTQFVLADIQSYGLPVSLPDRLAASLHDIHGLVPVLLMLVSAAYLVGFIIAALGRRLLGGQRQYWILAAGFASLPVAMMLMKTTMGITPFALAGTGSGLLLIALSGLAGAWVFARLTQNRGA